VAKSSSHGATWELEPHTRAKHEILRRYLEAWFPIMDIREGKFVYIDGFAGPGEYAGGELGSPLIALKTAAEHCRKLTGHAVFVFVESDERRLSHLRALIDREKAPGNFTILCFQGRFEDKMQQLDQHLRELSCEDAPWLAFIDPFGFSGTPFSIVENILRRKKSEVLVNFAYNSIQRFITRRDQDQHFDTLFGTREWTKASDLRGEERKLFLLDLYAQQLRAGGAKYVRSFGMLSKRGRPIYYLFFATKHVRGLQRMKEAMWRVDRSSGTHFCDATDPRQLVLFAEEPNYQSLRKMILERFRRQRVAVEEIENFVLADTPFRETHYKRHVLAPLEREGVIKVQRPPGRGRKGTFPQGTMIQFYSFLPPGASHTD